MKRLGLLSLCLLMLIFAACAAVKTETPAVPSAAESAAALRESAGQSAARPAPEAAAGRWVRIYAGLGEENLLYTFTGEEQILLFAELLENAERMPGIVDMKATDYSAVLNIADKPQSLLLWIGPEGGSFQYAEDSLTVYSMKAGDARKLYTLFTEFVTPVAERAALPDTNKIDLLLKYPPVDLNESEPPAPGLGVWTALGAEAMGHLLESADGRAELYLPGAPALSLELATVTCATSFKLQYKDAQTGEKLILEEHKGPLDFNPAEMKWKRTVYGDQVFYRRVIRLKNGTHTSLYWENNGWTFVLQTMGKLGETEILRYTDLQKQVFRKDAPETENGVLIEGKARAGEIAAKYPGLYFRQENNVTRAVETASKANFLKYMLERVNREGVHIYEDPKLRVRRYVVEEDGASITMQVGPVKGRDGMYFTARKAAVGFGRAFEGEIGIVLPAGSVKDQGRVAVEGITYAYSVTSNNDRSITEVRWTDRGDECCISETRSGYRPVTEQMIRAWTSHVQYVPKP